MTSRKTRAESNKKKKKAQRKNGGRKRPSGSSVGEPRGSPSGNTQRTAAIDQKNPTPVVAIFGRTNAEVVGGDRASSRPSAGSAPTRGTLANPDVHHDSSSSTRRAIFPATDARKERENECRKPVASLIDSADDGSRVEGTFESK